MDITSKIANSIRAKALQRRLFKSQSEENRELVLHTNVRSLNRSVFLERFIILLYDIKIFLRNRNDNYAELYDKQWLCELSFLVDFTGILTMLNRELQGKNKTLIDMINIDSFKNTIPLIINDLNIKKI
ncbi:hypothetical protein A3Q56_04522 [Intoshia linei]|uniref:Uncharacterized protein n=1 Tax=Intoshia linei TaxID=1819745 RepID=A0A177B0G2_9BILA|nr:hypothetical protein A3Q56_04522 [Intoshia linei]